MDSKASPSLAQPGMDLRSSLIRSTHTGAMRTFSWDFNCINWWSEAGFAPDRRRPGGNSASLWKGACGLITAALISVARHSLARKSIGELQGVRRLASGAGVGDGRELVPVRFGVAAGDPANDPEGVGFVAEEPCCVNQRGSPTAVAYCNQESSEGRSQGTIPANEGPGAGGCAWEFPGMSHERRHGLVSPRCPASPNNYEPFNFC